MSIILADGKTSTDGELAKHIAAKISIAFYYITAISICKQTYLASSTDLKVQMCIFAQRITIAASQIKAQLEYAEYSELAAYTFNGITSMNSVTIVSGDEQAAIVRSKEELDYDRASHF